MNIQELENKHCDIFNDLFDDYGSHYEEHTKLSIQFAIEMLNEILETIGISDCDYDIAIDNKIEELKKYL